MSVKFEIKDMYVEITNVCNLNCIYCCRNSGDWEKSEMSEETFRNILLSANKLECKNITLSGGEALLHSKFIKLVNLCKKYNYQITLVTNGTKLNELPISLYSSFNKIQISLDGGDSENNDSTRGEYVFDRVEGSLKYILAHGYIASKIAVKMTLTHDNYRSVDSLITFANKFQINEVGFSFLYKSGRAATLNEDIFMTDNDRKEVTCIINNLRDKYPMVEMHAPGYTDECPLLKNKGKSIVMPRINYKGAVYACQMFSDEFWIGNINEESFENMYLGERFLSLKAMGTNRYKFMYQCEHCYLKNKCKKGCYAISLMNNIFETDGNCCLRRLGAQEKYIVYKKKLMEKTDNK